MNAIINPIDIVSPKRGQSIGVGIWEQGMQSGGVSAGEPAAVYDIEKNSESVKAALVKMASKSSNKKIKSQSKTSSKQNIKLSLSRTPSRS